MGQTLADIGKHWPSNTSLALRPGYKVKEAGKQGRLVAVGELQPRVATPCSHQGLDPFFRPASARCEVRGARCQALSDDVVGVVTRHCGIAWLGAPTGSDLIPYSTVCVLIPWCLYHRSYSVEVLTIVLLPPCFTFYHRAFTTVLLQ